MFSNNEILERRDHGHDYSGLWASETAAGVAYNHFAFIIIVGRIK